jgi:hypothetical protein
MFLMVLGIVIILAWIYVLFLRPYLVAKYPAFGKFSAIEQTLFDKSRTILASRLYSIGGALVALQAMAASAGLDVTPIVQELAKWIPEGYRSLAVGIFLFLTGLAFEWLRKVTDGPVGSSAKQ